MSKSVVILTQFPALFHSEFVISLFAINFQVSYLSVDLEINLISEPCLLILVGILYIASLNVNLFVPSILV